MSAKSRLWQFLMNKRSATNAEIAEFMRGRMTTRTILYHPLPLKGDEKMDKITAIDEIINKKADKKLEDILFNKFIRREPNFDLTNNFVELTENVNIFKDDKTGKPIARIENVLRAIIDVLFERYKNEYRAKERDNFLNQLGSIQEYLNNQE